MTDILKHSRICFYLSTLTKRDQLDNNEVGSVGDSGSPPLATFLEYLSLLQQDMKNESKRTSALLAFSILTLIAEGYLFN